MTQETFKVKYFLMLRIIKYSASKSSADIYYNSFTYIWNMLIMSANICQTHLVCIINVLMPFINSK